LPTSQPDRLAIAMPARNASQTGLGATTNGVSKPTNVTSKPSDSSALV